MMAQRILGILAIAGLLGCAGTPFKNENILAIRVGMTEAEVVATAGSPYSKQVDPKTGFETWSWMNDNGLVKKTASVVLDGGRVVLVPTPGQSAYGAQYDVEKLARDKENRLRQEAFGRIALSQIEAKQAERQAYVDSRPELSPEVRASILSQKARIGMAAEQVRVSLGEPDNINRTVDRSGVDEQWRYGSVMTGKPLRVYFRNGIMTAWQD